MSVASMAHALEPLGEALRARRAFAQAVEAAQDPAATEGHEADTLALPWPPPHGISRGNVEVHAPGPGAIEDEPAVHLEEREVRADEDRVIRGVLDIDLGHAPARIDHDGPVSEEDLAADDGERLRMRELPALGAPPARQLGGGEDRQPVHLGRRQVHVEASSLASTSRLF